MSPLRLVGAILVAVGLVLACAPTLVYDPGPAADTFAAIERRIWWGGLAGLGALLVARTELRPFRLTVAAAALWIVLGFLVARVIGLALDGTDSAKQWMWVVVEAVIVVAAAGYMRVRKEPR